MATETYSTLLRNPAWQKKRLEILERDNFTCLLCFDTETELHIHHNEYIKGRKPWEYENSNFKTLCKCCHQVLEAFKSSHVTPVIAVKQYNKKAEYTLVSTILHHKTDGLILSISKFHDYGEPEHVLIIDQKPFSQISDLFAHAEKLIK